MYEIECWAVKSQQENKINIAEIIMLQWMSDHTRQYRIKNYIIKKSRGNSLCRKYGKILYWAA